MTMAKNPIRFMSKELPQTQSAVYPILSQIPEILEVESVANLTYIHSIAKNLEVKA